MILFFPGIQDETSVNKFWTFSGNASQCASCLHVRTQKLTTVLLASKSLSLLFSFSLSVHLMQPPVETIIEGFYIISLLCAQRDAHRKMLSRALQ